MVANYYRDVLDDDLECSECTPGVLENVQPVCKKNILLSLQNLL